MHWVISDDGHFILSKSGVDPGRNHGAMDMPKKVRTDRQMAFRLYIVYYSYFIYHLHRPSSDRITRGPKYCVKIYSIATT